MSSKTSIDECDIKQRLKPLSAQLFYHSLGSENNREIKQYSIRRQLSLIVTDVRTNMLKLNDTNLLMNMTTVSSFFLMIQ